MSFDTERRSIYSWVLEKWSPSFGPIFMENQAYDEPSGIPYALCSLIPVDSNQASLAGDENMFRHGGILQIDYLIPEDKGTASAKTLMDQLNTWMRNYEMTTSDENFLLFRSPNLRSLGNQNGRYRYVVSCDFNRDEFARNPALPPKPTPEPGIIMMVSNYQAGTARPVFPTWEHVIATSVLGPAATVDGNGDVLFSVTSIGRIEFHASLQMNGNREALVGYSKNGGPVTEFYRTPIEGNQPINIEASADITVINGDVISIFVSIDNPNNDLSWTDVQLIYVQTASP